MISQIGTSESSKTIKTCDELRLLWVTGDRTHSDGAVLSWAWPVFPTLADLRRRFLSRTDGNKRHNCVSMSYRGLLVGAISSGIGRNFVSEIFDELTTTRINHRMLL